VIRDAASPPYGLAVRRAQAAAGASADSKPAAASADARGGFAMPANRAAATRDFTTHA